MKQESWVILECTFETEEEAKEFENFLPMFEKKFQEENTLGEATVSREEDFDGDEKGIAFEVRITKDVCFEPYYEGSWSSPPEPARLVGEIYPQDILSEAAEMIAEDGYRFETIKIIDSALDEAGEISGDMWDYCSGGPVKEATALKWADVA